MTFKLKHHIFCKSLILWLKVLILLSIPSELTHAQGLRFHSNKLPINERTSYNVFEQSGVSFSGDFEINFKLSFYGFSEIGNIMRMKVGKAGIIFNLFYDKDDTNHYFLLNEEGKANLINIMFAKADIGLHQWFDVTIKYESKGESLSLEINGNKKRVNGILLNGKFNPTIEFGRSDHIIEVPSFAIAELKIISGGKIHLFPFRERQGNNVHDDKGRDIGHVENPYWMINDFYHWKQTANSHSYNVSGTNFDEARNEVFFFNRDSITIIDLTGKTQYTYKYNNICPININLGTNFYEPTSRRLYCYEVYDEKYNQNPSVASLNLDNFSWEIESYDRLPTQLHHHSTFYDKKSKGNIIFGGFGNAMYSNRFYKYEMDGNRWTKIETSGDSITPRYFSSMGCDKSGNSIYIFGGMGNESGKQLYGREYYFDFHRLDLESNKLSLIWDITWNDINVVPSRSMIIDGESFYTLCYPEYYTESQLKLYKFSIEDGNHEVIGDSIPIFSDKIKTNANLYFNHQLKRFYAVVQEFKDEDESNLSIFELSYPPVTKAEFYGKKKERSLSVALTIAILVTLAIFAFVATSTYKRRYRQKDVAQTKDPIRDENKMERKITVIDRKKSSIYLFGEFKCYDNNGMDITHLFSKKLKEAFLLISQNSFGQEGIPSRELSDLLWPERSFDEVKNTRNVTINRLRKLLEEFEGLEVKYEQGRYKISNNRATYCDFVRFNEIIENWYSGNDHEELIGILSRGKFLKANDSDILHDLQKEVENTIDSMITEIIITLDKEKQYDKIADFAKIAFHINPANIITLEILTAALLKLNMNDLAKEIQLTTIIEYKKMTGKDYPGKVLL